MKTRLNLSWSNWGFGIETLAESAARLERNGIRFIELHGNHYGPDLGYKVAETKKILGDHGVEVGGICGMFSADNDLSSNRAIHRQAAVDYLKRELEFAKQTGADYILVVPAAVGRPQAYDKTEFERSVETLRLVADLFVKHKVKAAIEPIRLGRNQSGFIRSPTRRNTSPPWATSRHWPYQRRRLSHAIRRIAHRRGVAGRGRPVGEFAHGRQQSLRTG